MEEHDPFGHDEENRLPLVHHQFNSDREQLEKLLLKRRNGHLISIQEVVLEHNPSHASVSQMRD